MRPTEQVTVSSDSSQEPRYRAISDYGVIGDCRTAALLGPDGSIDWCCLPHFDSPAVLCRLLDADRGGNFRLSPIGDSQSTMAYMDTTNVLQTLWVTESGRLRVVDYMPIRKRERGASLLQRLAANVPGQSHGLEAGLERELGNDVAAAHRINRMAS